MRKSRDEWFMQLAELYAERSTCCRASVGCLAVRDNRILGGGYVGSPPGQPHCTEVGCGGGTVDPRQQFRDNEPPVLIFPHGCTRTTHAEMNLIASLARQGTPCVDATMYTTHACCRVCAALVVAAGFIEVVYLHPYRLMEGVELLDKCNVRVRQYGLE